MKFDDLYNRVFLREQDEPSDVNSEVAHPDDFNDVDPMPLPEPGTSEDPSVPAVQTSSNLTDYITQLEDFADKLNGTDGSSLQSLVSKLDKPETPFEGIYNRTSAEIVDAAKTLRSVAEKIKSFVINSAKNTA